MIKNRKTWLFNFAVILLFFVPTNSAYSEAISKNDSRNIVPKGHTFGQSIFLKDKKFGYIDIFPLPLSYPKSFLRNERVFSGEIFTSQPDSSLDSHTIFIPTDYQNIIESTLAGYMKFSGINLKRYPSIISSKEDDCYFFLFITPYQFHVEDESKATVELHLRLIETSSLNTLWEDLIKKEVSRDGLPSTLKDNLFILLGNHKYNFQTQRSLLAEATYKCIQEFLGIISDSVKRKK